MNNTASCARFQSCQKLNNKVPSKNAVKSVMRYAELWITTIQLIHGIFYIHSRIWFVQLQKIWCYQNNIQVVLHVRLWHLISKDNNYARPLSGVSIKFLTWHQTNLPNLLFSSLFLLVVLVLLLGNLLALLPHHHLLELPLGQLPIPVLVVAVKNSSHLDYLDF